MVLLKITSENRANSHDFSINFQNLVLPGQQNDRYELALVSANIWYSWYNISTSYVNNTFYYNNGTVDQTVLIPNGIYKISELIKTIEDGIVSNGDTKTNIEIIANFNTGRIEISLLNKYTVNFTQGTLYEIVGFDNTSILNLNQKYISPHPGDINRGVTDISVNCNLVDSSYSNGESSQTLYSFSPNTSPYNLLTIQPSEKVYCQIHAHGGDAIPNMRIFITDNKNRIIDLNNEPTSFLFHLRKVK